MLRGMDVARLNFSHGTHDEHAVVIQRLRKVAAELGRTICILQDLQGPKIRTGRLKDHIPIPSASGQTVTITPQDVMGTTEMIATTYRGLAGDVKAGRAYPAVGRADRAGGAARFATAMSSAKCLTGACWASIRASTCRARMSVSPP